MTKSEAFRGCLIALFACASAPGCGSDDSGSGPASCVPGESNACACTDGAQGSQTCLSDGHYGDCVCGGTVLDGPEDPGASDPEIDTSDLDPLPGGVGGESNPLSCLGYPAPWFYVTQGNHQGGAIDLACELGENLANPFPAPAKVIQLTDSYTNRNCYNDVSEYNATCHNSQNPPSSSDACNNKLVLQTTVAGVTWQITMLHILGSAYNSAANRDFQVGDVVGPFSPIAVCGNVGWVCAGAGNDGSHLHLVLKNVDTGATPYPESMFSASCSALQSGEGCTPGSTCCGSDGKYLPAGSQGSQCDDSCHACNGGGGCYETCAQKCLSGDGLYCGGSVGLDPNSLYNCTGGVYTLSEPCPYGCNVAAAGSPDSCKSEPSGSCPDGDGYYCGSSLGLNSNTLYQCIGGNSSVVESCSNGCTVAPPGTPDYCTPSGGSCPSGDGVYCGGSLGLDPNKLYQCTGGTKTVIQTCSNGCTVAPPGTPDYCTPSSGSCPSGDGYYCGGSVGKDPDNLYKCIGGVVTLQQACPNSCVVAPPGQPDYCT